MEAAEKNRFAQRAGDIKKVMPKLEGPPNQREGVNDGTRPKYEDHAQAGRDIQKRARALHRQERTGIVRQKKKCNPLDNADQSELNVNDDGIEFPTTFTWLIHDATRNRSMIKLSRRCGLERACPRFSAWRIFPCVLLSELLISRQRPNRT